MGPLAPWQVRLVDFGSYAITEQITTVSHERPGEQPLGRPDAEPIGRPRDAIPEMIDI